MSEGNAVAVRERDTPLAPVPLPEGRYRPAVTIPSPEEVEALKAYGEMIAGSKLFPRVTSWQAAIVIIRYGQQLGIDEFSALKDIDWIEGKPACNAGLMNALITRDHGGEAIIPVKVSKDTCTISYKRREWTERREATLTLADMPQVLRKKDNWINYPADMLWARLISRIARQSFADTIKGLYTADELLDARAIEAQGRVVERAPTTEANAARPANPAVAQQSTVAPVPPLDAATGVAERDEDPPAPVSNGDAAHEKVIATWYANIDKAPTQRRLDEIHLMLVNGQLGDHDGLMQALADRSVVLHAEAEANGAQSDG